MPRIGVALRVFATLAACIAFNTMHYPAVWQMVAEAPPDGGAAGVQPPAATSRPAELPAAVATALPSPGAEQARRASAIATSESAISAAAAAPRASAYYGPPATDEHASPATAVLPIRVAQPAGVASPIPMVSGGLPLRESSAGGAVSPGMMGRSGSATSPGQTCASGRAIDGPMNPGGHGAKPPAVAAAQRPMIPLAWPEPIEASGSRAATTLTGIETTRGPAEAEFCRLPAVDRPGIAPITNRTELGGPGEPIPFYPSTGIN
jgi:hypothetical protein